MWGVRGGGGGWVGGGGEGANPSFQLVFFNTWQNVFRIFRFNME